jgi:hypothetical protein
MGNSARCSEFKEDPTRSVPGKRFPIREFAAKRHPKYAKCILINNPSIVTDFMIKIAKNPYLLAPVMPSDYPGQPKYAGVKPLVNVVKLQNPLHPFMDITNMVAFIHGMVALLTIDYRYPMPDVNFLPSKIYSSAWSDSSGQ